MYTMYSMCTEMTRPHTIKISLRTCPSARSRALGVPPALPAVPARRALVVGARVVLRALLVQRDLDIAQLA